MNRSKLPYFFLALSAVLAVSAVVMFVTRSGVLQRFSAARAAHAPQAPAAVESPPPKQDIPGLDKPLQPESPERTLRDLGLTTGIPHADPEALVNHIATVLESGDLVALGRLLGSDLCDESVRARLKALAAAHPIRVRRPEGIREVGELELNTRSRWSLSLDGAEPGRDRILLDLHKRDGKWSVEKLSLPPAPGEEVPRAVATDALGTADAFLQAVLGQDFEFACGFVDPKTVTDVKIATLCILFEEGEYRLRDAKPLRAMFVRGDTTGYLAQVETKSGAPGAEFALNLRQPAAGANWQITEINLDRLLADYSQRVAGGDIYYSPLVKNPQGGDTLALYFEFDEDQINPRTRRQLDIVAHILKADARKHITLSGHTDAMGTKEYNDNLSARRARTVCDFLTKSGVPATQIITQAKGASQPRRPNFTESGQDDPRGRRVNRRTEIYLDF